MGVNIAGDRRFLSISATIVSTIRQDDAFIEMILELIDLKVFGLYRFEQFKL